jgi:hypothetical protein
MKNKPLIYGLIGFLLLVVGLVIWNNYTLQLQKRPGDPLKSPSPITDKCGIENCHGLDITCGSNVPEACTEIYMAGDNCRQFASCEIIDGDCQLVTTEKFESCKACVEQCEEDYADDQIKFFQCESQCAMF